MSTSPSIQRRFRGATRHKLWKNVINVRHQDAASMHCTASMYGVHGRVVGLMWLGLRENITQRTSSGGSICASAKGQNSHRNDVEAQLTATLPDETWALGGRIGALPSKGVANTTRGRGCTVLWHVAHERTFRTLLLCSQRYDERYEPISLDGG